MATFMYSKRLIALCVGVVLFIGSTALVFLQPWAEGQTNGEKGEKGEKGKKKKDQFPGLIKPKMSDTIKANIYADNWFVMFVNGKLTAVDSIDFIPHNVVSVDILPEYPMTIAIMAKDNADPNTGLEYGTHIGDGGFILKFADGTVSNGKWKAKCFFKGPLDRDTKNPRVKHDPIPDDWYKVNFDDSKWEFATEYTEERVGPKEHFYQFDFKGAKWIWTDDLDLDNTVIFRYKIEKEGWKPRWNTRPNLDVSPECFKFHDYTQTDDGKKKDEKKKDDKGPRMPWLAAHFDELDANKDGILTAEELKAEVDRVFKLFDKNGDGKLTKDEYDVPRPDVKSPIAGFIRAHAEEIDANRDGVITREEVQAVMSRMFEKADRKRTGKITREEAAGK